MRSSSSATSFELLAVAQLALDRLHLLVEVVLALRALHLALHAGLDLLLDLQDRDLALHQPEHLLQPLGHGERLQELLLALDLDAEMAGDEVGQPRAVLRVGHRRQRLLGDRLLDLGVALELARDRARQRLDLRPLARGLLQRLGMGLEERLAAGVAGHAHPRATLDQHLHRAVGQLEELEHVGQHAGLVDALGGRVVLGGVALGGEQDLAVVAHHLLERAHRLLAADEERHDHVREHHDVAQRQHRVGLGFGHLRDPLGWQGGLAPSTAALAPLRSGTMWGWTAPPSTGRAARARGRPAAARRPARRPTAILGPAIAPEDQNSIYHPHGW